MTGNPIMRDLGQWLGQITAFPVVVKSSADRRAELTVADEYPVIIEETEGTLNVTCARELPADLQGIMEMSHLEQAALGQARASATPVVSKTEEIGGKQRVSFRFPLRLDGLTDNELTAAIWGAWKAQELLAIQLSTFKELEAVSGRMEALAAGEQAPSPAVEPGPAPSQPPTAEAVPTPAGRFCPSCGKQAKPEHRFCIGCGGPLEA